MKNYLPHAIQHNLLYGVLSDVKRAGVGVYLARVDQSVFNIVTLLSPCIVNWEDRGALRDSETMTRRASYDNLFLAAHRIAATGVPNDPMIDGPLTIGMLAVQVSPTALWALLEMNRERLPLLNQPHIFGIAAQELGAQKAERWVHEVSDGRR